jgi:hypothetical protein
LNSNLKVDSNIQLSFPKKKAHKALSNKIIRESTDHRVLCLEIDKKSIKKMFPNLLKEVEDEESKIRIDSVRSSLAEAENDAAKEASAEETIEVNEEEFTDVETEVPDKFRNYYPDVVDFIRRCDTKEQVEEIIAFMLKRGELTLEKACELQTQLKRDGVRSFGPKKVDNYYFKQSGLC